VRRLTVRAGEMTRIHLVQPAPGPVLTLQNASGGSREDVYSDTAGNASVKVVEDADLQALLDVLAERGFFDRVGPATGSRESIVIEQEDRSWQWSRRPPTGPDDPDLLAFHDCRAYVLAVYNRTTAWHTRRNITGRDLQREQETLQQRQQALRQKYGSSPERKDPPK
jgi:hypothetical protein